MPEVLKFYDLKARKAFSTNKYHYSFKSGRKFAVAEAPSGVKSYRIVSKK
jgi:hypothetical protein